MDDAGLVRVTILPSQRTSVNWNMVCSNDEGAGSRDGEFTLRRSGTRVLRKPFTNADSCTIAAGASLSRSGRVRVVILAG